MKRIAVIGAAALLAVCAYALEINDVYEVSVASGSQEISEAITGSGSIRKTGAGTLVLSGANTFTGGVSIEAGRVEVASSGALGSGPVAITSTGASGSGNVRFTVAATATRRRPATTRARAAPPRRACRRSFRAQASCAWRKVALA